MSLFPKFDPWAEIEETSNRAAKVAKVAKVQTTISSRISRPGSAAWDAVDWQSYFDERAAIAEIDGELSRADAEALAYDCCIVAWLNCNPPMQDDPDHCIHCGERLAETEALPFLTGDGGHIWMRSGCHSGWMVRRRGEAVPALARLGLTPQNRTESADVGELSG